MKKGEKTKKHFSMNYSTSGYCLTEYKIIKVNIFYPKKDVFTEIFLIILHNCFLSQNYKL